MKAANHDWKRGIGRGFSSERAQQAELAMPRGPAQPALTNFLPASDLASFTWPSLRLKFTARALCSLEEVSRTGSPCKYSNISVLNWPSKAFHIWRSPL